MNNEEKRKLVKNDYNAIAEIYNTSYGFHKSYVQHIDDFLHGLKPNAKVLEVGCGAGHYANYMQKKGYNVVGIDFSKQLLFLAKDKYPKLRLIETDVCDFNPRENYDGIICIDMLFHIPQDDLRKVLKNFKKWLNPKGKLCIIGDISEQTGEHVFVEELDDSQKIYYHYYTPNEYKQLLSQANFNIDDVLIVDSDCTSSYSNKLMIIQATAQITNKTLNN